MTPEEHEKSIRIIGGIAQVRNPILDDIKRHIRYLNDYHHVDGAVWAEMDVVRACLYQVREVNNGKSHNS